MPEPLVPNADLAQRQSRLFPNPHGDLASLHHREELPDQVQLGLYGGGSLLLDHGVPELCSWLIEKLPDLS